MALVVYDHGYRIQTPVDSLLSPRVVEQLTEMQPGRALPESEHPTNAPEADRRPARRAPTPTANPKKAREAYQETKSLNRRKEDLPDLTVDRIMTRPVINVLENSSIAQAWIQILSHRIQHLAVVNKEGRLIGMLTERDLLRRHSPVPHQGPALPRENIKGAYSTQLIVATPDTLVRQVALIIHENNVSCIPIIDAAGFAVGIVTRTDLLPLIINDSRFYNRA